MKLGALQSVVNAKLATYSVHRSRHDLLVSKKPSRFSSSRRPPRHLHVAGSSSHALSLFFRVRFLTKPVACADAHNAFLEVSFSITTSTIQVHLRVVPIPSCVPFSVFLPLSTVSSLVCLSDLFHSEAAYKIRFPGVFPTGKAPGFSSFRPLIVLASSVCTEVAFNAPTSPAARPGFSSHW